MHYAQPQGSFRSGIEPVLLAASVPARLEDVVLEAGCGAGAGLLCLASRTGASGLGADIDPALVDIATSNAAANGFTTLRFVAIDITEYRSEKRFDHGFTNPPYHPAEVPRSPDATRDRSKRSTPELLEQWTAALARLVRDGGTVTLSLPASRVAEALASYAAHRLGSIVVYPLWPRAGQPAKLVLLQGRVGGRAPTVLAAGLVLHVRDGFSREAEAVLRDGCALRLRA
ncbi:MAG: methyltransferase domain-containing protein [Acetobacteraceae bacterium]|nr:methyltransferase domain-containing protein [Acetobacteraceae bacterium]